MEKKLQEARANIELVIANTKMTRQEHEILKQNIELLYDEAVKKQENKKEVE